MGSSAIGFRIGAAALIAVAVIAAGVPAPARAVTESPGPQQLWERFPLNDRRDASDPRGATPSRIDDEPPRPLEREVPKAGGGHAASITAAQLVFLAAAVLLLLGLGAALVDSRFARGRWRKPALRVGLLVRAGVVEPLAELTRVGSPPGPAPTAALALTTSKRSAEAQQRPESDLEQWLSPTTAPDAILGTLRVVEDSSRNGSAPPEPLTVAPTTEEGGYVPEVEVLKAKLGPNSSKHPNARPHLEVGLLKRKPDRDADAVKTKVASIDKERLAPKDTLALKAKLTNANANAPSVRSLEARPDERPADRNALRDVAVVDAARAEGRSASERLSNLNISIWEVAFWLLGAATAVVLAVVAVSLMY
jgi:hypothetical protein